MDNLKFYEPLQKNQLYIDKTASLEKGIVVFPSIYIEGAAASGKTTAVRMLLSHHPEVTPVVFWMEEVQPDLGERLDDLRKRMEKELIWVIFENLHSGIDKEAYECICRFVIHLPENGRVILVGRDYPAKELLDLLWKRKMELIFPESLLLNRMEVQKMAEKGECQFSGKDIYALTGGWAGYAELLIRLSGQYRTLQQLQESYETQTYISQEILDGCNEKERGLIECASLSPWINEEMCGELWNLEDVGDAFALLERKGLFLYNPVKNRYKLAPILLGCKKKETLRQQEKLHEDRRRLAAWYEEKGFVKDALFVVKSEGNEKEYQDCLIKHYSKVPFLEVPYGQIMLRREPNLSLFYLRGMYCYGQQDFAGLVREIELVKSWQPKTEKERLQREEIYLNLLFVNPNVSFEDWFLVLEQAEKKKVRLYSVLGSGYSFLCGIRDLSGLFACTKKEENRMARIWKETLGDWEWMVYELARIDYYLETKREDSIPEEDWSLLQWVTGRDIEQSLFLASGQEMWRMRLAGFYLISKRLSNKADGSRKNQIRWLEESLLKEESEICVRNTEAIAGLYATWMKEPERLSKWLRYSEQDSLENINEDNYGAMCLQAKGYILLNRFGKAEKILTALIPYFQTYRRNRFYAECLFQMALINWDKEKKGNALRNIIESFLVTGNSRYVGFYTKYGAKGREVLEAYVEWLKLNTPEGWRRKKKYNYGNVLRMPVEDYMEVILRGAKKETRSNQGLKKQKEEERLTMMETIILQDISRGLTNTEICEEQNLKLPTVKSHIYSLYKKLGVNSRVQAVNKGKETGIIK